MPFFHGTTADRIPDILRHGLGGQDTGPRSEDCVRGVYLASDPRLAVHVLVMHYLNRGRAPGAPAPHAYLATIRVLAIDDARLDPCLLRPDPQVQGWTGSWLYTGTLDATGAPILTVEDVEHGMADQDPERWGWTVRPD